MLVRNFIEEVIDHESGAKEVFAFIREENAEGKNVKQIADDIAEKFYVMNYNEHENLYIQQVVEKVIENGDVDSVLGWNVKVNQWL